jgi:hypothetical protein
MVLPSEGEWHVMIDVMHDACLGGTPGCFRVKRVDTKLIDCSKDDKRVAFNRAASRILRVPVRRLLPLTIPAALPLYKIGALPILDPSTLVFLALATNTFSGRPSPFAIQFRMPRADLPKTPRRSTTHYLFYHFINGRRSAGRGMAACKLY